MCLTISKDFNEQGFNVPTLEVLLNKYSKISNKDIIVYKVLKIINDKSDILLRTPYQYTNVDKNGDILISNRLSFMEGYSLIDIHKGIHAFTNLKKAKGPLNFFTTYIVVESIIPAGTPYIKGDNDDIVSFMLFIPPIKLKNNQIYYEL